MHIKLIMLYKYERKMLHKYFLCYACRAHAHILLVFYIRCIRTSKMYHEIKHS
jgi:hypothetical protein